MIRFFQLLFEKVFLGEASFENKIIQSKNKIELKTSDSKFKTIAIHPFLFDDFNPRLFKKQTVLRWERIEKIGSDYLGISVLRDSNNKILFAVKYCTYIQTFNDGRSFVFYSWNGSHRDEKQFLDIYFFETELLRPIEDVSKKALLSFSKDKNAGALFNTFVDVEQIPMPLSASTIEYHFKNSFKSIDELLVVYNLDWLEEGPGTCLLRILPKEGSIEIYPQDWFNKSVYYDFNDQWIALFERDRLTKKIHGRGIRLGDFVLDHSYKELEKV